MDFNNEEKLDGFLGNVDKISDLIKNLSSASEEDRDKAIADADSFLQGESVKTLKKPAPDRTGVNRTVINHGAYNTPQPASNASVGGGDQDGFLKALEKDAQDRVVKRRLAKAEATVLKDEGNTAFKLGDYERAVQLYTEALDKLKDYRELWTNRAQAYMKLEKYSEALTDCDWAQRCDEKYVKAYVLEAKAHIGLRDYDVAISVYEKAIEIDKSREKMLREFIAEVELMKNAVAQEKDAKQLFDSGAQHPATLVDVLNKVNVAGELPLYYDGGVRVLADLLKDDKCQTLFRTEGGLEMYFKHPFFSRIMVDASVKSLGKEELDACSGMFSLLCSATINNEESQRQLISQDTFPKVIFRFLDVNVLKKKRRIRLSCLSLLLCLSEIGRKYLSARFDVREFLKCLFQLVVYGDTIAVQSLNIVNNMALDNRFRKTLYDSLDTVLPSFEDLLNSDKHTDVIPSCITIMTNLCTDDKLRKAMANRPAMINSCVDYLNKFPSSHLHQSPAYHKAVHSTLGFLMNITLDKTDTVKSSAVAITKAALHYLNKQTDVQERVIGLLSHVLPVSPPAVEHFLVDEQRLETLIALLPQSLYLQYTVKSLTACTQHSPAACKLLASNHAAVTKLIDVLNSDNEILVGNACLCLSHCVLERSVHETLDKESMKRLLVVVREANSGVVKQNAAILVGKLVKANPRHLESLRELDGIGILHNSTRHYKL